MKKTIKITLFVLVMFTIFSVTSVKAETFKFELEDGTKKQIESNKNTVGELKKEIENTIGIMKEYQVWSIGEDYIREDMPFDDGEYEYLLNINNTDTIKIYERKELNDTIELKSYYPKEISSSLTGEELDKAKQDRYYEFISIFEYVFKYQYYGYSLDFSYGENACNEDYTRCKLLITATGEEYKTVDIKYVYDEKIEEEIDNLTKELGSKAIFKLKDFELINLWLNGGSSINYSDEYKKIVAYKNFYLDIRAGSDDSLTTESFGIGYYTYDGTLYKAINELGTKGYNILYVDSDVSNDKLLETIQNRIDNYIGKGKMTIYVSDYDVDTYYNEKKSGLNQYYEPENEFYKEEMKELDELKNTSSDGKIYVAKIGNNEYGFVIGKNTEKMYTPKLITSDFKTNITISTDKTNTIPLDTMINIKELTSGEEYNKILKILNITNNEMFDISLFSNSIKDYITKLKDGSFEVRIPITEKFKDKELVVYYVDDEGKITEYPVTIEDEYAIFNTNHFSIYTLAEKTITEEKNPNTGDNILVYIVLGGVALLGIITCAVVYLKKKKTN
ncbi:MAG: LPXTG cell wall anchor domain-containing protein [Bacilli bacterium]